MSHATYMPEPFKPELFREQVIAASLLIKDKFPNVNYIVGTGISGITVASAISFNLDKNLYVIRKDKDNTHSRVYSATTAMEGNPKYSEYLSLNKEGLTAVIIDDLISSGRTMKRIVDILENEKIKCIGAILYHESAYDGKPFGRGKLNFPVYSTSSAID